MFDIFLIKFLAFVAAFLAIDATGHNTKMVTLFSFIDVAHYDTPPSSPTSIGNLYVSHLLAHLCQLTLPLATYVNGSRSL